MRTLHVRCGSDIRDTLRAAGIPGDFVEYADPVCQGPVPADLDEPALQEARAAFIAKAYGYGHEHIRMRLAREALGVAEAHRYDRVVLWFEHDLYDQTVLIRLLDRFADDAEMRGRIFLLCIDSFPGIERFIGLGQLTPAQLSMLAGRERPISEAQLSEGRRAWSAYRARDPRGIAEIVRAGLPALPLVAPAFRRHLQDLPWTADGLGLTQRLALWAVQAGATRWAEIFAAVQRDDPLPFLGDLMLLPILRDLASGAHPALASVGGDRFEITEIGHALVARSADWVVLNGIDRWLGGIHLIGRDAPWRWDGASARVVPG